MRASWMALALVCLMSLLGCDEKLYYVGELGELCDMGRPPDSAPAQPPCPAAKGLSGDNLICVDFAAPQTTIASLTAKGWDFSVAASNCPGWEIMGGLLEVMNFGSFGNGNCGLTPPMITPAQIQKYGRLTVSIQQRIDLSDPEQQARIFLNDDSDMQNLMWQATGKKNVPRQQTTITIATTELPMLLKNNGFKWLLKLSSQGVTSRKG